MNRILNHPDEVVADSVRGYLAFHSSQVAAVENPRVVKHVSAPKQGKVGVVTGGGSGHEPAFLGYVGENFLDAVAIGEIFSSPTAKSFHDAIRASNGGRGVAVLYGNYAGDNMNVKMAIKLAAKDGIEVKTVVANDDVASAKPEERLKRRGVAGEILMWKIGGARAAEGGTLDEVIAAAQKAIDNTRSIGIGLTPCTIPAVGKPNFEILDGQMEVGIGHHGEPGVEVVPVETAAQMADRMLGIVLPDLPFQSGDEVVVLLSGLGATPLMELYLLYGHIADQLKANNIKIAQPILGNLFTSLDMMGVTLTLMKLDEELKRLFFAPARSAGWAQQAGGAGNGRE
jgi:phosphoenolpyruvate---glycerone phosphotransferase subunit DhaK